MFAHEYTVTEEAFEVDSDVVSTATDGERSEEKRFEDRTAGELAEEAFAKFCADEFDDDEWERIPDTEGTHEYDFEVQGAKVDVKGRQMWLDGTPQDPDLLGRIHEDAEPRTHAHIYVQVRLFKTMRSGEVRGVISGFATEEQLADAREFERKSGDAYKPLVGAGSLQKMDDLRTGIETTLDAFDARGGHVCMLDEMQESEHNTLDLSKVEANHPEDCVCLV